MSDRYLCKAKDKDDGKWVEGYYLHDDICNKSYIFPRDSYANESDKVGEEGCLHLLAFEVDPSTICQYTGLTDNNGRKVWENDIIKYHFGDTYALIKYGGYQSCFDSRKAEHIGFYADWQGKEDLRKDLGYWINIVDTLVIGNIFDNLELLDERGGTIISGEVHLDNDNGDWLEICKEYLEKFLRRYRMKIDDLIYELLEEPVVQEDDSIVFTSRSIELIHKIAEECNTISTVKKTQHKREEYAKGLSAEEIYIDMLIKIVYAPTSIHMRIAPKMLIPIISQKLKERGI